MFKAPLELMMYDCRNVNEKIHTHVVSLTYLRCFSAM